MTGWMLRGAVIAGALGASAGLNGARADFDADPTPMPPGEVARIDVVDLVAPGSTPEPGAGGIEPYGTVDDEPGAADHDAWVESIWSTP